MAYLNWDERYTIGITAIDEEHREQVRLINKLHDEFKSSADEVHLIEIFETLIACTRNHFDDEERIMKELNYPEIEDHLKAHQILLHDAEMFINEIKLGKRMLSLEMISFLKDWLMLHIIDNDMKFKYFLAKKG